MLETVIPAFSPESVKAAVQNGADAVYLGLGGFNEKEFALAAQYCRVRGAKVYLSLESAVRDSDFSEALDIASRAFNLGVSAIEVGDLGLLRALRQLFPTAKLHLGISAGIHSAAGAATAAYLGANRVILSPDLSFSENLNICSSSKIEFELPCHGPVCTAEPGTCRLSALSGRGAACFGRCSGTCRRTYGFGSRSDGFDLTLRDICLADKISELDGIGLSAVRVLGSHRRAEYSALTARIYSAAVKGKAYDPRDMELLEKTFAPSGMSGGFFDTAEPVGLFGEQKDEPRHPQALLSGVRGEYLGGEAARVPVKLFARIQRGRPAMVAISDNDGNAVYAEGAVPRASFGHDELTAVSIKTYLHNLAPSPFFCAEAESSVEGGLYIPGADIISLRQHAIELLIKERARFTPPISASSPELIKLLNPDAPPELNISVLTAGQLTAELAGLKPSVLYVPLLELLSSPSAITPFWENGVTEICAVLPPVIHDGDEAKILSELSKLDEIHVKQVMVSNLGQIVPCAAAGFTVRADMGLGAYNSHTLRVLKELKLSSVTLPPELKFSEIHALSKAIPTEAVMYGRLPLMTSSACLIKAASGVCSCGRSTQLRDRRSVYPVVRQYKCRSTLYSPSKLFLAGRARDYSSLGLSSIRLDFTTESAEECILIVQRFLRQNKYEPSAKTKGLYY